jgi:hypothetical protein
MRLIRSPGCRQQPVREPRSGSCAAAIAVRLPAHPRAAPTSPSSLPRPCRRWHGASRATPDGPPRPQEPSEEEREAIRANVDKATQMLEEILEEVSDEVFIAQATAYLTDEPEDGSPEALRQAVARRLEFLDANFLAALNAYVQARRSLARLAATAPLPATLPAVGATPHAPRCEASQLPPVRARRLQRRGRTSRWCRC